MALPIFYTLNSQRELHTMSKFGSLGYKFDSNSNATSPQEAFNKAKLFAKSKGYVIDGNGIEALENKKKYYVIPFKSQGVVSQGSQGLTTQRLTQGFQDTKQGLMQGFQRFKAGKRRTRKNKTHRNKSRRNKSRKHRK